MNTRRHSRFVSFYHLAGAVVLAFAAVAAAANRGVINDPDGYVNLRAGQDVNAAVVAKVQTDAPFTFECEDGSEWCKVRLASGKSGWMHRSRIRLHFTPKDLPVDDPAGESEIDEFARRRGLDYTSVARRAARSEAEALKQFFALSDGVDGAAAESHAEYLPVVYHLVGDAKLSQFLAAQPLAFRVMVRNAILGYTPMASVSDYLDRHFPETTKTLIPGEIVDWHSPDGRYAIRKVFSDWFGVDASKVTRAEVIDSASSEALCEITHADIGTGAHREGEVLWSPDSKRFAYLSSNLTSPGNLFSKPNPVPERKQTILFEVADRSCKRIDITPTAPPDRVSDRELDNAILGHEHTEPVRWLTGDTLLLQRHEYYQTLRPGEIGEVKFDQVHSFDRLYEVTIKIEPDGRATADWKRREEADADSPDNS